MLFRSTLIELYHPFFWTVILDYNLTSKTNGKSSRGANVRVMRGPVFLSRAVVGAESE